MSFIPIQKRMENNCHKCTSSKRSFLWNFSYRIKKHFFIDKITNNLQQLSFSIARETWTNLLWITRCFHKSSIKVRQLNGIDTTVGEEITVQKRNIKESILQYHSFQQLDKVLEPNESGAKTVFSTDWQGFLN